MMIPSVHLNGTGEKNLTEELQVARTAIRAALDALRQVTVHGRDYYVQGPHAYGQARSEMDTRLAALQQIEDDLLEMHMDILRQAQR